MAKAIDLGQLKCGRCDEVKGTVYQVGDQQFSCLSCLTYSEYRMGGRWLVNHVVTMNDARVPLRTQGRKQKTR